MEAQQPEADLSQNPNEENGQWMAANDGSWQEGEAGSLRNLCLRHLRR
ncbi:MAG: hypothetical protein ACLTSZ_03265 [Lachnospiraceae bacterium]